jgi:hypothetical protein
MGSIRTILAVLVSLTLAFAPVANVAVANSCSMTTAMSNSGAADFPCHDCMPGCGSMAQCQTSAGCVSHCYTGSGLVPSLTGLTTPALDGLKTADIQLLSSLSIRPPAPPPRA